MLYNNTCIGGNMELMVKTITKMADLLKESFGDRLNILEIDEEKEKTITK